MKKDSGQALLVILLIMAVALTVGLAVVSRSVTDIRLSQEQEESSRAFSAAEAGLEAALAGDTIGDYQGFTIDVAEAPLGGDLTYRFTKPVKEGDVQTVWLVGHDDSGEIIPDDNPEFYNARFTGTEIRLYWGNEDQAAGEPGTPAIEATLIYNDGSFKSYKYAFDPDGRGNFAGAIGGGLVDGYNFPFKAEITSLPTDPGLNPLYALRLKLLYNDEEQNLAVQVVGDDLPVQGNCYNVTASREETGISRRIEQCQLYKAPPAIFDYVMFSENALIKAEE